MAEDIMESKMTEVSSVLMVRGLDKDGNSVNIDTRDLFKNYFKEQGLYERDVNNLAENGVYYVNGTTLNAPGSGILLVFKVDIAVVQIAFSVFSGEMTHRVLLYDNGTWNKWSPWK